MMSEMTDEQIYNLLQDADLELDPAWSTLADRILAVDAEMVDASALPRRQMPFRRLLFGRHTVLSMVILIGVVAVLWSNSTVYAKVKSLQDSLQQKLTELVAKKSAAVLTQTEFFSRELERRHYLLDDFGGGASSDYEAIGDPGSPDARLRIKCHRHRDLEELGFQPQAFAGLIFYGNAVVTGAFDPIELDKVKRLTFQFRYAGSNGVFFLKLKNLDNYETQPVLIESNEDRGTWQTFVLAPAENPFTKPLTSGGVASSALRTITVYTDDFFDSDLVEIEIRNLQLEMK